MRHSRRVRTRYRVGTIAVAAASVGHELCVARGYLVQRRHGTQLVVRRFVVGFFRALQPWRLLADALLHLRDARRVQGPLHGSGAVVTAQRQPSNAPVEIVRALALQKRSRDNITVDQSILIIQRDRNSRVRTHGVLIFVVI